MSWINFDLIPAHKPIVVHCSYRTGSTALCDWFAQELGRVNFDEAYHSVLYKKRYEDFISFRSTSNNYIWKLMPDQIDSKNQVDITTYFNKSFKIKLYRENVVDQITSWVISYKTNYWHVQNPDKVYGYTVSKISDGWLIDHVKRILRNNAQVDQMLPDHLADMHLKYEDIEHSIKGRYKKRPKPNNYVEVFDLVSNAVEKVRRQNAR